jgi:hypothetical protein
VKWVLTVVMRWREWLGNNKELEADSGSEENERHRVGFDRGRHWRPGRWFGQNPSHVTEKSNLGERRRRSSFGLWWHALFSNFWVRIRIRVNGVCGFQHVEYDYWFWEKKIKEVQKRSRRVEYDYWFWEKKLRKDMGACHNSAEFPISECHVIFFSAHRK